MTAQISLTPIISIIAGGLTLVSGFFLVPFIGAVGVTVYFLAASIYYAKSR